MKTGKLIFRPRLFTSALTAAVLVLLLGLGRWQLARMHEKEALFAAFAAGGGPAIELTEIQEGSDRYQHVLVRGRYDSAHQFLLDNMTHDGQAGYRVLTPLRTETGKVLLVDRGWLPMGTTREALPDVTVAEDSRSIMGRLDELPRAGIQLAAASSGSGWPRVLSYPQMSELRAALQMPVEARIMLLDADQQAGYVREWRPSTFPPERHLGYAITWFALAAAVAVTYIVTNLSRGPERA